MKNKLKDSAFFTGRSVDNSFYKTFFENLKKEIDFSQGHFFYKKESKYSSVYKVEFSKTDDKAFELKVSVKIGNLKVGYLLLIRETPFTQKEKEIALKKSEDLAEKIKDFELSIIFKNQLLILQNAIVEKNVATEILKEKNEQLIQSDRIKSEFLANVSHELRTPLNSIIGFSTALKDEMLGSLNEKQKSYANKILSSAIHLTGLINDIIDMTKIESGRMNINLKPYNPNSIIKEVINIVEPLALEKNIKIETRFLTEKSTPLDYIKFRQVVYNLLGNAIKFSHKNSKIIVSTKETNGKIQIKIKDFGIGIDKKDYKKIFEKFVQLDNIYTKTYSSGGLGLTISLEFVKLMGGELKLKSELNKGSEFIVEFKK